MPGKQELLGEHNPAGHYPLESFEKEKKAKEFGIQGSSKRETGAQLSRGEPRYVDSQVEGQQESGRLLKTRNWKYSLLLLGDTALETVLDAEGALGPLFFLGKIYEVWIYLSGSICSHLPLMHRQPNIPMGEVLLVQPKFTLFSTNASHLGRGSFPEVAFLQVPPSQGFSLCRTFF